MGAAHRKPLTAGCLALLLGLSAGSLFADSPEALLDPGPYSSSVAAGGVGNLGLTPQDYRIDIPLNGSIWLERQYTRVGDPGPFSRGVTEHATDLLKVQLSKRGTFQLGQEQALATGPFDTTNTYSRKRTAGWAQGYGAGPTAGNLTVAHEDSYTQDRLTGYCWSRSDTANLTLGLGKSLGLTGSGGLVDALAQSATTTRSANATLGRPGSSDLALGEFHYNSSGVDMARTDITQGILRTPNLSLGDVKSSLAASQTHTETLGLGGETDNGLTLTSQVGKRVTLTAGRVAANRNYAADSVTYTYGPQVKVGPDTTVSATCSDTATVGAGVSTQKTLEVTKAPPDGKGLGLHAGYTDFHIPGVTVAPTTDLRLDYATAKAWAFHGLYHDESTRPSAEMAAGVQMPVLGATVKLNYSQYAMDPTTYLVQNSRVYGAEVARPLGWGLSGKVGYQYSDSLAGDSAQSHGVQIALAGDSKVLGQVDVQFQTSFPYSPTTGATPPPSNVVITFSRPIGTTGSLALSGHHTLPPLTPGLPPSPADDQVQLDLKTAW